MLDGLKFCLHACAHRRRRLRLLLWLRLWPLLLRIDVAVRINILRYHHTGLGMSVGGWVRKAERKPWDFCTLVTSAQIISQLSQPFLDRSWLDQQNP